MQLHPQLFSEIANYAAKPWPPAAEKRLAQRTSLSAPVTVAPVRGDVAGRPVEVIVRDIAISGLGIVSTQPMRFGEQFMVTLPRPAAAPLRICCTVTRWSPLGEGRFAIGAIFDHIMECEVEAQRHLPRIPEAA